MRVGLFLSGVLSGCLLTSASADSYSHRYTNGEHVELWANKVGPYANPQEAYEFYTLPYCAPRTKHHPDKKGRFKEWKIHSLGEQLGGHALRHSGHDVTFSSNGGDHSETCSTNNLSKQDAELFSQAIQHRWFYQMYLDDLPVWGMVGEMLSSDKLNDKFKDDVERLEHLVDVPDDQASSLKPYVYTRRKLEIYNNQDQIVKVDLSSDPKSLKLVEEGKDYEFTLVVSFIQTDEEFHSRFDRYLDHDFFKHPIHWFSVFNSFMMVLFLMGLVALILLRTLRKDYARYGLVHDLEADETIDDDDRKPLAGAATEDAGWKQVHGDVFRAPSLLPLFAAVLGSGWQLFVLTLCVILFAVLGPLHGEVHEERGEVLHAILVCYSLSSIIAGYMSGRYFKLYSATKRNAGPSAWWQATMALTVLVMPTITVTLISFLNGLSLLYGTINTIPFFVMFKLFLIWVFVSVPLCVLGTMLGRHAKSFSTKQDAFPCRVNAIPRPIPEQVPLYGKPLGLVPLAGLLSFGSIFIELYYVLTSLWNYKFYHVYGFLLGVYAILCIVVGMTSIIVVYFLLNAENYHWQWTAFASGASTSAYVFVYGIYYFVAKTQMTGLLQTSFYFGYMALIAINLGILCGTLGHAAASRFVRAIFQNVKVD